LPEIFVSSIQNLIVIWFRLRAVLPIFTTSKNWFAWFDAQEVYSSSWRLTALVPQGGTGVAVLTGVKVPVVEKVGVEVGVMVRVAVGVEVLIKV
jgi:hypothetical protein